MKIIFEKEYLEELYFYGYTRKKKYRYPSGIVRKYVFVIELIKRSDSIAQLYQNHSLQIKKLKGNKKNVESIRISLKYRLEYKIIYEIRSDKEEEIVSIIELSNHYEPK
ncbi:MAG: plasmid maintenance system killer protein [Marinilabiliales bacterium]|nr:MAG: plasmid maintenance system killer protein [Marinilabiliales bacterium]